MALKDKTRTDNPSETKAKNVFKIAFGSKMPSNAMNQPISSAKKKNPKVFYSSHLFAF